MRGIKNNSLYKFLNFIKIAPSPPSLIAASFIDIIKLFNSVSDLIKSGTEYFNFPKFLET